MEKPPRTTVLPLNLAGEYANPIRGAISFHHVWAQAVLQWHVDPKTSAPGIPNSGSVAVRLKSEVWLCASCRGKSTSYRIPRFRVKVRVTLKSSCTNPA